MTITGTDSKPRLRSPFGTSRARAERCRHLRPQREAAPIIVAVDNSPASSAAVDAAIALTRELAAPLVFVYVRKDPSCALGEPYYQRRLDAEMHAARRALDDALAVAADVGVPMSAEQLAGSPARRVVEFARARGAQLLVVGSRRRRLGRGVLRDVIRRADRPVVVATIAA
jgi:nucleotide-binding universal stress UspA family protein